MNPFKIRLDGNFLRPDVDRVALERELRVKIGIPDDQPIEFIEPSAKLSEIERRALETSRGGVSDDDYDDHDEGDEDA